MIKLNEKKVKRDTRGHFIFPVQKLKFDEQGRPLRREPYKVVYDKSMSTLHPAPLPSEDELPLFEKAYGYTLIKGKKYIHLCEISVLHREFEYTGTSIASVLVHTGKVIMFTPKLSLI